MYAKIRERHTFKNKFKVLGEQRKDLVYIESVCVSEWVAWVVRVNQAVDQIGEVGGQGWGVGA